MKIQTYKTSAERLEAIADIVEANDGRWNQSHYTSREDRWRNLLRPNAVRRQHDCGAYACIAGWGVTMTPHSAKNPLSDTWGEAGAQALELSEPLSWWLFSPSLGEYALRAGTRRRRIAKILRHLATLNPDERNSNLVPGLDRFLCHGGKLS